ncbi:MAG: hypothetical protein OEO23_10010 [Gemmatimonadota bacterium]|nr:hypothetical protein [Gemmatimonadota bacterium]
MSVPATPYPARVRGRIERARRQGAWALAIVAAGSVLVLSFLGYGLATAIRLGDDAGTRAALIGVAVVLGVNVFSWALYRRQRRLLREAVTELGDLFDEQGDSRSEGASPSQE